MNKKNEHFKNEINKTIIFIFFLGLSIVIIANIFYFNLSGIKFNSENFLTILPFNLIGLSLSLHLVMIIIYNLGKLVSYYHLK
jgi:hypothetical protein